MGRTCVADFFCVVGIPLERLQKELQSGIASFNADFLNKSGSPPPQQDQPRTCSEQTGEASAAATADNLQQPDTKHHSHSSIEKNHVKLDEEEVSSFLSLLDIEAQLLDRYPPQKLSASEATFPQGIELFCMPDGLKLIQGGRMPQFYTFLTTSETGLHLHGSCLTIYEEVPEETIRAAGLGSPQSPIFMEKSLCIVSRLPFVDGFREFLKSLYRLSISYPRIPIERYVCNFINEVPMPPAGKVRVLYTIADTELHFQRPPLNEPTSSIGVPFERLFGVLSVESILQIFRCILLEQKILFVSSQLSLLTDVAECMMSLLYPLTWDHVYIPVLPRSLTGMLQAPMPFCVGIHSAWKAEVFEHLQQGTIICDIDEDKVVESGEGLALLPTLPEKEAEKLKKALAPVSLAHYRKVTGLEFDGEGALWKESVLHHFDDAFAQSALPARFNTSATEGGNCDVVTENSDWATAKDAFFRFFVSILRTYQKFICSSESGSSRPKEGEPASFNVQAYANSQHSSRRKFYDIFLSTQAVSTFLSECCSAAPTYDVLFFNESIIAKMNRSRLRWFKRSTPFLRDASYAVSKTVVCAAPDASNLPAEEEGPCCSTSSVFPSLDPTLFCEPRHLPPMPDSGAGGEMMSSRSPWSLSGGSSNLWLPPSKTLMKPGNRDAFETSTYCLWFLGLAATSKECTECEPTARYKRHAQDCLDTALDVLAQMRDRAIPRDELIYRALIHSAGRTGNTHVAMKILSAMHDDCIVVDPLSIKNLMSALARHGSRSRSSSSVDAKSGVGGDGVGDSSVLQSEVQWRDATNDEEDGQENAGDDVSVKENAANATIEDGDADRRRSQSLGVGTLEMLFPDFFLDTARESCPSCEHSMRLSDVWQGFTECDANTYTTQCPSCKTRFVARFSVACSVEKWEGTTGPNTPLFFEALSPWVLCKEMQTLLAANEADAFIDLRSSSPTLFWNLVLYFKECNLPLRSILL